MPKGMTAFAIVLGSAMLFQGVPAADAGEVRGIEVVNGATGTRAEIELQGAGQYKTISLAGPDRLVVDLPESSAPKGLKLPAGAGVVTSVRTGQPVPGTLRVVFDLAGPVKAMSPRMEGSGASSRLVIEWPGDGPSSGGTVAASSTSASQATSALADAARQAAVSAAVPAPTPAAEVPAAAPSTPVTSVPAGVLSPAAILAGQPVPGVELPADAPMTVAPGVTVATGRPAPVKAPAVPADAPATVLPQPKLAMRAGMRPLIIAIDAGHGGQDSGAIGPTGKYEKNVTLAIARQLAKQIDATPGLKSYLTRDGDYFIPLNQRAVKARAAHADMFISIHADAAENRSASGSSVYVLSLKGATSQRARWLADKENASDLVGGRNLQKVDSTLGSVLIDLAQSGHMKASENAADFVLDGLKQVNNTHKSHLEKANFAVLRTSDMPAMLVETAFISNYAEEKQLTDPSYQRRLATAILGGVETYFSREPPPGTLFAARAQAALADNGGVTAGGGSP